MTNGDNKPWPQQRTNGKQMTNEGWMAKGGWTMHGGWTRNGGCMMNGEQTTKGDETQGWGTMNHGHHKLQPQLQPDASHCASTLATNARWSSCFIYLMYIVKHLYNYLRLSMWLILTAIWLARSPQSNFSTTCLPHLIKFHSHLICCYPDFMFTILFSFVYLLHRHTWPGTKQMQGQRKALPSTRPAHGALRA